MNLCAIGRAASIGLDFYLFGNGYGLSAPSFDQKFYWVGGRFYTFMHGFGAQLHSREWRHPKPQERRVIAGREFRPFRSRRHGLRVEIAWAMQLPRDIDVAHAELRQLERDLCK